MFGWVVGLLRSRPDLAVVTAGTFQDREAIDMGIYFNYCHPLPSHMHPKLQV